MSVRVFAPAKINLTLEIARPRTDGYHPLQSAVTFADIGDWISVSLAETLALDVVGEFAAGLANEPDNLVLRAARLLAEVVGRAPQARIVLEKNLPISSGIGGGSSDAAAALKALNALWRASLDEPALYEIAARLGADVPVCLGARSAWMTGVGEKIAPLSIPPLHAVLVNPMKPCSTALVFRKFDSLGAGRDHFVAETPIWRDAEEALAGMSALGNDLIAPARAIVPEIREVEAALRDSADARYVAVSGSGATVFAIVDNASDAQALASRVGADRRDWWVRAAVLGAT